jgi:methylisocitrate lyase
MQDLGINIVIYPVTSLRIAMGAVESAFERIRDEGTQEGVVPQMQTRARLYELLNYEEYNKFDTSIFNFKV